MRSKQEIIKEMNETQNLYDKLIMEIGLKYARYKASNKESLVPIINEKVDAFQKVELRLKSLEKELIKSEE